MGDFAEPNGPNLNGCYLIKTKGGGSQARWLFARLDSSSSTAPLPVCLLCNGFFRAGARGAITARLELYYSLAFTRYCHHQYGMVYGIQREVGGGAYIAQWVCNSIAIG